jgi:hypothetical protein
VILPSDEVLSKGGTSDKLSVLVVEREMGGNPVLEKQSEVCEATLLGWSIDDIIFEGNSSTSRSMDRIEALQVSPRHADVTGLST